MIHGTDRWSIQAVLLISKCLVEMADTYLVLMHILWLDKIGSQKYAKNRFHSRHADNLKIGSEEADARRL